MIFIVFQKKDYHPKLKGEVNNLLIVLRCLQPTAQIIVAVCSIPFEALITTIRAYGVTKQYKSPTYGGEGGLRRRCSRIIVKISERWCPPFQIRFFSFFLMPVTPLNLTRPFNTKGSISYLVLTLLKTHQLTWDFLRVVQ